MQVPELCGLRVCPAGPPGCAAPREAEDRNQRAANTVAVPRDEWGEPRGVASDHGPHEHRFVGGRARGHGEDSSIPS